MIKDNIKIIKDLTKIFLKSAYQDINIINSEVIDSIDLSMQDALSLYNIFQQPKQYTSNGITIKEGDTEFDINKWIQLAINEFKNK